MTRICVDVRCRDTMLKALRLCLVVCALTSTVTNHMTIMFAKAGRDLCHRDRQC